MHCMGTTPPFQEHPRVLIDEPFLCENYRGRPGGIFKERSNHRRQAALSDERPNLPAHVTSTSPFVPVVNIGESAGILRKLILRERFPFRGPRWRCRRRTPIFVFSDRTPTRILSFPETLFCGTFLYTFLPSRVPFFSLHRMVACTHQSDKCPRFWITEIGTHDTDIWSTSEKILRIRPCASDRYPRTPSLLTML